jgi:hypothetical protein
MKAIGVIAIIIVAAKLMYKGRKRKDQRFKEHKWIKK